MTEKSRQVAEDASANPRTASDVALENKIAATTRRRGRYDVVEIDKKAADSILVERSAVLASLVAAPQPKKRHLLWQK